jgi:predicted metal-dependent HD superfamily phosphohydrolase
VPDAPEAVTRAWGEACWALGIRARKVALDDLVARYGEPHRRYHDLSHIEACLRVFDEHRGLAERPGEVIAALLFHDAIYDPTRTDNEARSAALARSVLVDASDDSIARIAAAIEATASHEAHDADARLVLDVDLSILGSDAITYDAFERAIRAEYAHVPDDAFRIGRTAVLARFEARSPIFHTEGLRAQLEAPAHANLARTIASLQR